MNIDKVALPTNLKFGIFLFITFLSASIYFYFINYSILSLFFLVFGLLILVIIFINTEILVPLNRLWFKFGLLLGRIVSPIIMGLIFFGIFSPIAIFMRLVGRDELRLNFKHQSSYWIKRGKVNSTGSFKQQF